MVKIFQMLMNNEMEEIRGNDIGMIFQDPMTSLNPVYTVGDQLIEPLLKHRKISRTEAKEEAIKMLGLVGIPSPEKRMKQYPHEFSGGMRQRVMIAMSLICEPKLIIADEPTTALRCYNSSSNIRFNEGFKRKIKYFNNINNS